MSLNTSDVLVVGGGPSGLAAAIAMRQRGLQVTVVDGMQPPIDKACGEGLMPDSRAELAKLGVELSCKDGAEFYGIHFSSSNADHDGRFDQSINPHQMGANGDQVTANFRNGRGLGVRRLRLHQRLVDRAQQSGVQLQWNSPVQFSGSGDVRIGGKKVAYRYLVGADGQNSRVRSFAGLDGGTLLSRRFGFRAHYRIAPWSSPTSDHPHVEVHWGEYGQAYVTPVAEDEICIAVISRHSRVRTEAILNSLPLLREKLRNAVCTSRERGAVTTTRRLRCVTRGNIALIGDASGSADAVTGEGMAMAFRQAVLLAAAIERDKLELYSARHPATLRMPQTMARVMLLMDRFPLIRKRAMRMLAQQPALFARMLDVHLGEESMPSFLRSKGLQVGWGLLVPSPATASAHS